MSPRGSVAVVIPYRAGCPWRERALHWVLRRYGADHPEWEVVIGECAPGPFSRTQAILDGMRRTRASVLIVADGDVYCDPADAVEQLDTWAIPHHLIHRLSPESTLQVFHGDDWHGLPLSTDNRQDSRPYKGHETDTLCVYRAEVLREVPPDPRFIGWGQEGDAHRTVLHTLVGPPWRGHDDLVHLWHPPQPRKSRVVGNDENLALYRRYRRAQGNQTAMRAILREVMSCSSSSSSTTTVSPKF